MARRDVSAQERESTEEKARERAKGDVPDHVFCAKDHTGLVTVLHIMVERANVLYYLAKDTRTLHRFDKLIWKVTDVTGITGAGAFPVLVPMFAEFCKF